MTNQVRIAVQSMVNRATTYNAHTGRKDAQTSQREQYFFYVHILTQGHTLHEFHTSLTAHVKILHNTLLPHSLEHSSLHPERRSGCPQIFTMYENYLNT
jgi:hypothetical protein